MMDQDAGVGGMGDEEGLMLAHFAEQAYLDYAVSVVRGRALPDVTDGQKPVQRRIMYAMDAMGLGPQARPVKSARVVGDVLGKYHPHGDQAAYDAMVRMAQDFVLRYPLIDGQGNFGSRDGDNAAAMRYTEARLTAFSRLLLDELDEGTVDFVPNYDGSQHEPVCLPARLPIMLLNGASGIAVGMATEIPAHNLREVARACVALLREPDLPDAKLHALIPGPDFPGGGQLISTADDIAQVYASGRGTLRVRARWHFEELARGQWQLVVTELPPGTSSQKVLEAIEELTNPRPRAGRKTLSAEQQQTRTQVLSLLDAVRDESGKQAPVRLVFEPRTGRIDRDEFVSVLLVRTGLEGNVPVNLVCIDTDGRPGQRSLRQILQSWLDYRLGTLTRRTRHRLDKVLDRIHILEGRLIVHLNVDEVIRTIREADEPRPALMTRFNLSERQADDILDMRLRQLARLESIRIEQELDQKRADRQQLQVLLDHPGAMRRLMAREIEADARQYGDDRRTLIEEARRAVLDSPVVDEAITLVVSRKGWLRTRLGHGLDPGQFAFKSGDDLYGLLECRSTQDLAALSDTGRSFGVALSQVPSGRGDGQPITAMVELAAGSRIVHVLAGDPAQRLLLGVDSGYGFTARLGDLLTRQHAGKQFITVAAGETLLRPLELHEGDHAVALLSGKGRLLVVALAELKSLPAGGRGTILMGLDPGDTIAQWAPVNDRGLVLRGVYRARQTELVLTPAELAAYAGRRARKGKWLDVKIKLPSLWSARED
ncbi:DNA topoisomerase IV subunit A [Castellaniella sp.]|uniref:DNA topoisomerase IV subunit A n=1 Tax=Castellaniella sp. TaxID=1955812 RepID=UPI00355F9F71